MIKANCCPPMTIILCGKFYLYFFLYTYLYKYIYNFNFNIDILLLMYIQEDWLGYPNISTVP